MTSSINYNAVIRSSSPDTSTEGQDDFLLKTRTFDFTITDDDDEFDPPSQVTNVSERCLITREIKPQVCPVMSSLKPPNTIPASSEVQPSALRLAASQQPTVEMLQSLGIKVRDFAYESTLPPIAPIPRVPRQIQPSARPLKRTSREWEEEHGVSSRSPRPQFGREATNGVTATDRKLNSLVRRPTEPLELDFSAPKPMMDLRRVSPLGSQVPFHTPKTRSGSPPTSPPFGSPSQEPDEGSQESEMVMTPPGGEFCYIEDTSSIPASQLETETSAIVTEDTTPQLSQPATTSFVTSVCVSQVVDTLGFIPNSPREAKRGIRGHATKGSMEKGPRYVLRRRSLLATHTPTRSRYPHPLTLTKKGSGNGSPVRQRRLSR